MPEDPRDWPASDEREEIHDPANPPNALLSPESRSKALMSYVAPIVVLFVVVGIALIYWANRGPSTDTTDEGTENAIGTAGSDSPGGFNPGPEFDDTGDELRFRGGGPGVDQNANAADGGAGAETLMDLDAVANTTSGRRVRLEDVEVAAVEANTLWIGSGDSRVAVMAPEGTTVNEGDRVDVQGMTETDSEGTVRIRASDVRTR